MDAILENRRIGAFADALPRSPLQLNRIHEADAELIDLRDGSGRVLVAKTDGLAEEIEAGLYTDPEQIGWMAVTSALSDLAAVGADPLGVLVSLTLPPDASDAFVRRLAAGASAASEAAQTFILGGDTNEGATLVVTVSAIGFVPRDGLLTRRGAQRGDVVYLTGAAGLGSVLALARLEGAAITIPFRPSARIVEGRLLRGRARCCIDTSDGVLHALDTLARVNERKFLIEDRWEQILHPAALEVARRRGLPPWLLLAGVHGEYELLFTVPPHREARACEMLTAVGAAPIRVGTVEDGLGVWVGGADRRARLDTAAIRNASAGAGRDPRSYVESLLAIAARGGVPS